MFRVYTEDFMYRIDLYNVHVKCLEYTLKICTELYNWAVQCTCKIFRAHRRYDVQNCIIELYNVHVKCLEYTEDMMYRIVYRAVQCTC